MNRHVVFGTGQVGHPLVETPRGRRPRRRRRQPRGAGRLSGARGRSAGTPPTRRSPTASRAPAPTPSTSASTRRATSAGPRSSRPCSAACSPGRPSAGARLVVLDNLYSYGPPRGAALVETMPANPTSAKSATRAAMTEELLEAHQAGRVEVAIGRASDYFGPGALRSALGETVFGPALQRQDRPGDGRPRPAAQLLLHPRRRRRPRHPRHRPTAPRARSGTCRSPRRAPLGRSSTQVYDAAGSRPRLLAAGAPTLRALGIVKPAMREYLHTLYQFTDPWVVDDTKFRAAFGDPHDPTRRGPRHHPRLVPRPSRRRRPLTPRDTHHTQETAMTTPTTTRTTFARDDARRAGAALTLASAPRHRRLHRARHGLRVPADPRGADRRHPRPLPRPPDRGRHLVRRPGRQRGADGTGRHLARPARRRHPRPLDHRPRHRRGHRPGHRAAALGHPRARHQRRRPRPRATRRRRGPLRAAAHAARQGHRRDPRLRPHRRLHRPRGRSRSVAPSCRPGWRTPASPPRA